MSGDDAAVHPTAVVHPQARLDTGVRVGPFAHIGPGVVIGKKTIIEAGVVISGLTEIGESCRFSPHSTIGTDPQDVGYKGEETRLEIGNDNFFREFVTVHRGSVKGGGLTRVGDGNYIMAYAHIAHDCRVGNRVTLTNGATLGGHVEVGDLAYISAFCGVHQFCRIGGYSFVGGYSVITQDVLPFCKVAGARPTHFYGMNSVLLRRLGFSRERIGVIKQLFQIFFHSELNTSQAAERIEAEIPAAEDRDLILTFIRSSQRGIIKKSAESWETPSE